MNRAFLAALRQIFVGLCVATVAVSASAQASDPVIDRVKKTGTLRIGYNPSNKPFAFNDANGKAIGYAIDLCRLVAVNLGPALGMADPIKVEYKEIKSSERIPLLVQGEIDMECGASTNTFERQKSVAFSLTYFTAAGRMLIKKSLGINDYRGLSNQNKVLVVTGTTGQATLPARLTSLGNSTTIVEVPTEAVAEEMLKDGKADAYVTDDVLLYAVLSRMPKPDEWQVVGKNLSIEPYGLMLPKGATEFENQVDTVLREVFRTGAINALYRQWFQTRDFNMPLNYLTREAFKWPNKVGVGKSF
jgi:ABC-type amino acid transport substrate-binding protein